MRLANTAGQHLDEGKFINRSLLTLGHIIWKLSRKSRAVSAGRKSAHGHGHGHHGSTTGSTSSRQSYGGNGHLPFRNSKLTRLLQPALSGHAHMAIVCTAAPSVECLLETHGTLKFASRARRVLTRATVNELSSSTSSAGDSGSSVLRKYRARLRDLDEQLETVQRRLLLAASSPRSGGHGRGPSASAAANAATLEERRTELQFAVSNLQRSILNAVPPSLPMPPLQQEDSDDGERLSEQFRPSSLRPVAEDQVVAAPLSAPAVLATGSGGGLRMRPSLVTARSSGSDSQNNSNKTLVGSGGSGSTKTLPLSTSSSRGLADLGDDDGETKGEEDEPEHEEAVAGPPPSPSVASAAEAPGGRLSLTSVLMGKYTTELERLERREGRWSEGAAAGADVGDLLREFVRGLEIAQAEQETRMSKIRELEVENRRLRALMDGEQGP